MIEEYNFGSIIVDGKIYDSDVEVFWNGEVFPWPRKESHVIDLEDVKQAVEQSPDTIVIGTGESGAAKVTEEAKIFIRGKGIRLIIDRTDEATKTFNVINEASEEEEGEQDLVVGLFHLTC